MTRQLRNLICIAVGSAGMLFSRHYSGPMAGLFHDYGANGFVSFVVYFLLTYFRLPLGASKLANAGYALVVVWGQEAAQLAGLYPGTYDPLDLLVDAAGVGVALGADVLLGRGQIPKAHGAT